MNRSSTIVESHPDPENIRVEFEKGVRAICRVCSDHRLKVVQNLALELEAEWAEAISNEEPEYGLYVDLMYSEAEMIVEKGWGEFRDPQDVELLGSIFGFATVDETARAEGEGLYSGGVRETTEQDLDKEDVTSGEVKVAGEDTMDTAG